MSLANETDIIVKELVKKWMQSYHRGSLRFFILHLLLYKGHHKDNENQCRKSIHGYHIAKEIEKVTDGKWHPTTASIYPLLKQFKKEGIIEEVEPPIEGKGDFKESQGKRITKDYQLTPLGIKVAEEVENARKEFAKSFARQKKRIPPIPELRLKLKFSNEEILELIKEVNLDDLETEQIHLKRAVNTLNETLGLIEKEIRHRKEN